MSQDFDRYLRDFKDGAQRTANDAASYVQNVVNPQPQQSGFAKAASEALEYIREALKSGAEMASNAFNNATSTNRSNNPPSNNNRNSNSR